MSKKSNGCFEGKRKITSLMIIGISIVLIVHALLVICFNTYNYDLDSTVFVIFGIVLFLISISLGIKKDLENIWIFAAFNLIAWSFLFGPVFLFTVTDGDFPYAIISKDSYNDTLIISYNLIIENSEETETLAKTGDSLCYNLTLKNTGNESKTYYFLMAYRKFEESQSKIIFENTTQQTETLAPNERILKNNTCKRMNHGIYLIELYVDDENLINEMTGKVKDFDSSDFKNQELSFKPDTPQSITVLTMNDYVSIQT